MDGWIVVRTKLDSKQLDIDLKNAEKKLQQYEREAEKLTKLQVNAKIELQPYEEQILLIREMTDEANKYAFSAEQITDNLKEEEKQIVELSHQYSKQITNLEQINQQIKENAQNQQFIKNEIKEINANLTQTQAYDDIKENIDDVGKSVTKILKKVTRWGLAVFGIRTAYMGIRKAISLVEGSNENVASQIQVMTNAVANSLLPAVEKVVDMIAKLMIYLNYIVKQLTGTFLFDFDSAFKNASDNEIKTAKSAKELKKTITGFDEMNIISDNSNENSGNKAIQNPFEGWEETEIPSWLNGIVEFGKWVIENWSLVLDLLIGIKMFIDILTGNWIGLLIDFVVLIIAHLHDFEAVWKAIVWAWESFWTWLDNAIADFLLWIASLGEKSTEIFTNLVLWIYDNVIKPIGEFFSNLWKKIFNFFSDGIAKIKDFFSPIATWINDKVIKPIKKFFGNLWEALKGGPTSFANFVIEKIEWMVNKIINGVNWLIKQLNKVSFDVPDWVPLIGGKKFGFNISQISEVKLPRLAKGTIVNAPGKGVLTPDGRAIYGEAGPEAYLPLSNTQLLEQLGSTIGKYITINANINNTMNGRVISRELKKINANNDFATNS